MAASSTPDPVVEAIDLSKRYRPSDLAALVPIPWLRRRQELGGADEPLIDDDDDLGDDDLDDDDDVEEPAREPSDRTVWALQDVNFTLGPGRVLGVVGENGAGKSTLIRVLAGITPPTKGQVVTRGRIAPTFAISSAFLDRPKTGEQCIYQTARFCQIPRAVAAAAIEPIREFTELGDGLSRRVRTYSSGEAQRLAYAISLFLDPDLVLSDGVLAVGDHAFRVRCMEELQARIDRGLSVVVTTHDTKLLRRLCTDALWLREGRVEAFGAPSEVVPGYEAGVSAAVRARAKGVVADEDPGADEADIETAPPAALAAPAPPSEPAKPARPARPTDDAEVAIRSAGIFDTAGNPLDLLRTDDEALIELCFELRSAPKDLRCVITLASENGTRLRIAQPSLYEAAEPGVYVVTAHLPRRALPVASLKGQAAVLEYVGDDRRAMARRSFRFETFSDAGGTASVAPRALRRLPWDVALVSELPGGARG